MSNGNPPPQNTPLNPPPKGSVTEKDPPRIILVVVLSVVFAGTVLGAFLGANGDHWGNVKALLDLLLPAQTALLGTAVAFYMTE
jgi:hypothetical protein